MCVEGVPRGGGGVGERGGGGGDKGGGGKGVLKLTFTAASVKRSNLSPRMTYSILTTVYSNQSISLFPVGK